MSSDISKVNTQDIAAVEEVTDIQHRAKVIRDNAIKYAVSKLSAAWQDKDLRTLSQSKDFLPHLKCGLAKGVGDLLTEKDVQVKEVYLFEPEANPDIESFVFKNINSFATAP